MRTPIATSLGACTRAASALVISFALDCGGSEVTESRSTPPTPEQGTLTINLATPNADDGIMLLTVTGPSVLGIAPAPGLELLETQSTAGSPNTSTVLVRGKLMTGAIAQLTVRGRDLGATYTASVQSIAAGATGGYARRQDLSGYRVTIRP